MQDALTALCRPRRDWDVLRDARHVARAAKAAGDPQDGLAVVPPRKTRFGGPLALSKVHWVRPELVAEMTYLSWSEDGLLRHTVFVGLREDKPANDVRREAPGF